MTKPDIEAIYPLSPMQQGLLFHSLYAPGSGVYFEQLSCRIQGDLDVNAFRRAWQAVMDRHSVLRTSFLWEGLKEPMQVVHRTAKAGWTEQDWRNVSINEQPEALERFLESDRMEGFEFSRAPLMRLALLRIGSDSFYFVWSSHHILFDGWCAQLLVDEVFTLYEAFTKGATPEMRQPRPFRDYIAWLKRQDLTRAELFWREELKGFASPIRIGGGNGRGRSEKAEEREEQSILIERETTSDLDAMGRRAQVTVNTIVQAALALVLSRHTGESDVVFGVTLSGRSAPLNGIESLIGLLINTLPARVGLCADETVRSYLKRLNVKQAHVMEYEYSPLARVRGWSELPGGTPLFETLFLFQNYPVDGAIRERAGSGLRISQVTTFERVNYPLMLIAGTGPELLLKAGYDCSRFEAVEVARLLRHLQSALKQLIHDPERRVGDIQLLTDCEQQQLLREWNDSRNDYGEFPCLHSLFEMRAERTPDAVVVRTDNQELSCADLNRRANRLAHYLRKKGVGPEIRVAVCSGRSPDMLVAILGILKAGGAYVPLDADYPPARLSYMLSDSATRILISEETGEGFTSEPSTETICLKRDSERIGREDTSNPGLANSSSQLAYVIYTSGSTGRPKGVAITHAGASALLHWARDAYSENQLEAILSSTSICFDLSVFELFVSLCFGGRAILVENGMALPNLTAKEGITLINTVPSVIRALLNDGGLPKRPITVNLAGEALSRDLVDDLYRGSAQEVYNLYGPTETTTYSTTERIAREGDEAPSIGRPIANTEVYILNDGIHVAPIGAAGDIHIGGSGLARGYLERPDATAERFVPHPFSREAGSRLYRTGDLARYRADGKIEYLGRLDHQVKIRGFRIELGEIETVLSHHPRVRECAATVREDKPGEKRLVAYVVLSEEAGSAADLRSYLRARLPEYMVPSVFVDLCRLPLTPNGKLDRKALPAPFQNPGFPDDEPRTAVEQTLAAIWAGVLGLERIGVRQNFFDLGGDSILSMQIVSRASQTGIVITPRQMFRHPTIAELAKVAGTSGRPAATQGMVTGPVALTPIQAWFFAQDMSEPHRFNQSMLIDCRAPLKRTRFEAAIRTLLAHHDALRMRFCESSGRWLQSNAEEVAGSVVWWIDLSGLDALTRQQAFERATEAVQASLNLREGSVFRAACFDLSPGRPERVLLVAHHLAVDGVSWRILLEDLEAAYGQLARGEAVQLPPKTTSYQQWAEALQEYRRDGGGREEAGYWLATAGRPVSALPRDCFAGRNSVCSAAAASAELSVDETERLIREAPKAYRCELQEILVAALVESVTRWSCDKGLLIDLEAHGRDEDLVTADLTRTVGWFTAIYPVWLPRIADDPRRQLEEVRERMRAVPRRGIGYGLLRYLERDSAIAGELAGAPSAEICFNYLGQLDQALIPNGFFFPRGAARGERSPNQRRLWLLEVNCWISQSKLEARWIYSSDLHAPRSVEGLAGDYVTTLRRFIDQAAVFDQNESNLPAPGVDDWDLDGILAGIRVRPGEIIS